MLEQKRITILLVEDEALIAMSQKMFLEKYGYKVVTISTGEMAIEILSKGSQVELALVPESKKEPLEAIGYTVVLARSAEQAVEIVRANDDIELVLMDIDLGRGMDGTQAAEIILEQRDIPIIFLSNHTEPEVVAKTEKITSYGYVVKNSGITVLDASIKMAFKLFETNKRLKAELLERKRIDDLLIISESRYRQLFETAKEGILVLDAETGMIVEVNPFLAELLGYSLDSFRGKFVWDIGFLNDIVGNKAKFRELREKKYLRYEDLPLRTASGRIVAVEFISNVYERADLKLIQCNIRDITERRETESGLDAARKRLAVIKEESDAASEFSESVINTVREPLLALDRDLRVVTASQSFYSVFKARPEETIGKLIYDLGNNQWDIPALRELLENILPRQEAFEDYMVEHDFASIGKRIMLLNARQIRQTAGKQGTILLAIEDITERKAAEKAVEALLLGKDVMLREVHHRIKNSMNTIKSLLGLQAGLLSDPAAIDALEDSESRVQSMMVLYDKLYRSVNFSEISIKEYLPALVDEIIGNFPNSAFVRVEKDFADFSLDAKKMQSLGIIVNELLTNIMKYAFRGRAEGRICISAGLAGDRAALKIRDDGVGIPESVNFTTSSGFGLMLVRTLTDQIKGTIRIERENGTSILLEFPKQEGAEDDP
jgi:PAS domain S-box-containing protein